MAGELDVDLVEIAATGRPAGVPADGLRQVQVPGAEEGGRGQGQAEGHRDQGSQVPARHRRRRLQRSRCATCAASSTKTATRARSRCASAAARSPTRTSACALLERIRDELADVVGGRAHAQARRAPDDHGAGAEAEVRIEGVRAPGSGHRGREKKRLQANKHRRKPAAPADSNLRRSSHMPKMKTKRARPSASACVRGAPSSAVRRSSATS